MTKAELEQLIAQDLARKDMKNVTKAQVMDALQAAPAGTGAQLMDAIRNHHAQRTGEIIVSAVLDYLTTESLTEAQTMLTDNTLSLTELDRWLG